MGQGISGKGYGPVYSGRKGKLVGSSRRIPVVAVGAVGVLRRLSVAGEIGALHREGAAEPADVCEASGFVRRMIATRVGEMVYHGAGEIRPLVFLHGIRGGASSRAWSKVAPAFVGRHRVIAHGWVSWGESHRPRRSLSFDDYATGLRALLGKSWASRPWSWPGRSPPASPRSCHEGISGETAPVYDVRIVDPGPWKHGGAPR